MRKDTDPNPAEQSGLPSPSPSTGRLRLSWDWLLARLSTHSITEPYPEPRLLLW